MTSLYFAYGSNMSPTVMAERCPGAVPLGPARLPGYRLAFDRPSKRWGGHVADVLAAPGEEVWGVLWQVTGDHLVSLDRFEGVATGAYRRITVPVRNARRRREAITYVVCEPAAEGRPSAAYAEVMRQGVAAFKVPWRRGDTTTSR